MRAVRDEGSPLRHRVLQIMVIDEHCGRLRKGSMMTSYPMNWVDPRRPLWIEFLRRHRRALSLSRRHVC
jgi:hypothetical protein